MAQSDSLEHVQCALPGDAGLHVPQQQRELHVLDGTEHRDEIERLEDEPHRLGPMPGPLGIAHGEEIAALDQYVAPVDVIEAGEAVEKSGLARSGRPHHGDHLAPLDTQVHVVEGEDLATS